jgi:hypothetical protein
MNAETIASWAKIGLPIMLAVFCVVSRAGAAEPWVANIEQFKTQSLVEQARSLDRCAGAFEALAEANSNKPHTAKVWQSNAELFLNLAAWNWAVDIHRKTQKDVEIKTLISKMQDLADLEKEDIGAALEGGNRLYLKAMKHSCVDVLGPG